MGLRGEGEMGAAAPARAVQLWIVGGAALITCGLARGARRFSDLVPPTH